jgi:hypothetical protein
MTWRLCFFAACLCVAFRLHASSKRRILDTMSIPIVIPDHPLRAQDLEQFRGNPFDTMIKFVADLRLRRVALGGEMHADAENALLATESRQEDLWGGNLYAWEAQPRIEYTSLINIRPAEGNRSIMLSNADLRAFMASVVRDWVLLSW